MAKKNTKKKKMMWRLEKKKGGNGRQQKRKRKWIRKPDREKEFYQQGPFIFLKNKIK